MSRVLELVGTMLGAEHVYSAGLLEVTVPGERRRERFWQLRGRQWRVERDDGLTFISDQGVGSVTMVDGTVTERGPALRPGVLLADQLLRPRYALVWGRPGEDWRLTDQLTEVAERRVRVELHPVDGQAARGHLVVDPVTGILHELALGSSRTVLLALEEIGSPDTPALFAFPGS